LIGSSHALAAAQVAAPFIVELMLLGSLPRWLQQPHRVQFFFEHCASLRQPLRLSRV
jgi:hypothetical protein